MDIYHYVAKNDAIVKAETLLTKIENLCLSLEFFPERGHIPEELQRLALMNFREIHFKPYRIFYQIIDDTVYVHCILDGRRNLQSLLWQRLISK